jgi:hypothetical protein
MSLKHAKQSAPLCELLTESMCSVVCFASDSVTIKLVITLRDRRRGQ